MTDTEAIDACLARYAPEIRSQLVAARAHLASHSAHSHETRLKSRAAVQRSRTPGASSDVRASRR